MLGKKTGQGVTHNTQLTAVPLRTGVPRCLMCTLVRIGLFLWAYSAYTGIQRRRTVCRFIWIRASSSDIMWATTHQEGSQNDSKNFF